LGGNGGKNRVITRGRKEGENIRDAWSRTEETYTHSNPNQQTAKIKPERQTTGRRVTRGFEKGHTEKSLADHELKEKHFTKKRAGNLEKKPANSKEKGTGPEKRMRGLLKGKRNCPPRVGRDEEGGGGAEGGNRKTAVVEENGTGNGGRGSKKKNEEILTPQNGRVDGAKGASRGVDWNSVPERQRKNKTQVERTQR